MEPTATVELFREDELRTLDPLVRKVWAVQIGAWVLMLLVGVFTYELVQFFGGEEALPPGVLSGLVLLSGTAALVAVPRLRFRFWRYALTSDELYLERGILTRVRTIVPLRRVQHLDVAQGILEREFGLGRLIVHTAGSRSGDVVLPGLRNEDAERLRDQVKRYIREDAE